MICLKLIDTPVGKMRIGATDEGICLFDFQYRRSIDTIMRRIETHANDKFGDGEHPHFQLLETQIGEYFAGQRKEFDVPLHFAGTPFQKAFGMDYCRYPMGKRDPTKSNPYFWEMKKPFVR
jgi:O6-methylguanine-DNA--protein-cysteine methyltransferase